ncbi:flavin monoamine oxidase family protein [Kordiimonas gwangyangensis]|uniref:flavin monoamine oxidase family protein n=1 Tax=Kordiimonas gwangyangensis TaxID=288022 RepID=UPI00037DBC75|nr:NAD(P)/FAD-dependent oxidoreductase [Kordiimonas gwangyangensis]
MVVAEKESASRGHVVIIGAGIAGLASALKLEELGFRATVLEATERPGGRIQTLRVFSDSLYAEAGATYIPGVHDLTNDYIKRFEVKLHPIPEDKLFTCWTIGGRRVRVGSVSEDWPVDLTEEERALGLVGILEKYVGEVAAALGDTRDPAWPSEDLRPYDEMSYCDFLRSRGASDGAISLIRRIFPDIHGEGIENVSALFCLRDFLNEGGGWSLIEGGSETFPKKMAAALEGRIHYGASVKAVAHDAEKATVHYEQGGQHRELTADRVIFALQFSALKMISVTPALSSAKQTAITQLGHSSVTRVFLQMKERYWGDNGPEYMGISDTPALGVRDATFALKGRRGVLECYIPGVAGRRIAEMDAKQQLATALEYIEAVVPGASEHVELSAVKSWDADPNIRGGYAYFRPGEMFSLMPLINIPEGVFHFAGDHASPWPSWIQGALHSAHRVADEIDAAFK